jgi:hypothetical protein
VVPQDQDLNLFTAPIVRIRYRQDYNNGGKYCSIVSGNGGVERLTGFSTGTHLWAFRFTHTHTYAHTHTHTHTGAPSCTWHTHTLTHAHTHTYTQEHHYVPGTDARTHTYTHRHADTHTHTHAQEYHHVPGPDGDRGGLAAAVPRTW